MKTSSLSDLNKEVLRLPPKRIAEIAIRLAKHKKENKELLNYLLFESDDQQSYIENVKSEIDEIFLQINRTNLYQAKKTIRKILSMVNKQIRFSGTVSTEIELRIYFCKKLLATHIPFHKSQVLLNLYIKQINKIESALEKLHEDLQFDYRTELDSVRLK